MDRKQGNRATYMWQQALPPEAISSWEELRIPHGTISDLDLELVGLFDHGWELTCLVNVVSSCLSSCTGNYLTNLTSLHGKKGITSFIVSAAYFL